MVKCMIPIEKHEIENASDDGILQLKVDLLMGKLTQDMFAFPISELYDFIQNILHKRVMEDK